MPKPVGGAANTAINKKLNESLSLAIREKKMNLCLPIKGFRSGKNSRKTTADGLE